MAVVESSAQAKSKATTFEMVIIGVDGKPRANLGVVAASYSNPARQWWFDHVEKPRADRRIRNANKQTLEVQP